MRIARSYFLVSIIIYVILFVCSCGTLKDFQEPWFEEVQTIDLETTPDGAFSVAAVHCLYDDFITGGTPGGTWSFGSPPPVGSTISISDIGTSNPCIDICAFGAGIYHFLYSAPDNPDCHNCEAPPPASVMLRCLNCELELNPVCNE